MNESVLSILQRVRPSLPPGLIDEEGYEHLARVADQLPARLTTFWGFECRLGESPARADILFETRKQSRGQRLLSGHAPSSLDSFCQRWDPWRRLREFSKLWVEPKHPFSKHIRNTWLEFDTATASPATQSAELIECPSIFIGPDTGPLEKEHLSSLILDAAAIFGYTDGGSLSLPTFTSALPDGARLFQIGLMLSRKNPGLRVCVEKLASEKIPDWLDQLGWKGDNRALTELLGTITPLVKTIALNLNLTIAGLDEKIRLECYMDWLVDDAEQWAPLLDFIEQADLCLPQKRKGLLEFPGITPSLGISASLGEQVLFLRLFRKIHHIKLSFRAGRVIEAKAYLALSRPGLHLEDPSHAERDAWLVE